MPALLTTDIVAVIGAGTMGAGVAQVAAAAGHSVLLFDQAEGAAKIGIQRTAQGLDTLVGRGRISATERDALLARITPVNSLQELAPAALVIEAIVENLQVKQDLFCQLETICVGGVAPTILASNTSSLSITALGAAMQHPERLVGMHFFNPAPVMKLVEVISGLATDPAIAECIYYTASDWGKKAVYARSTPGFIVNRIARPFYGEALRLLQEGAASIATIDAVMREGGGFRMGPFELMDLIGHDINYAVTCSVFESHYGDTRFTPSLRQKELVDAGFLGRKSGRGFYNYQDNNRDTNSLSVETEEAKKKPAVVVVSGDAFFAAQLLTMLQSAAIEVQRGVESTDNTARSNTMTLRVGAAVMKLTDGRLASQRAAEEGINNLLVFDLALDYESATRIALAPADQASEQAIADAIGFWQALGKQVSVIDDVPGMCVMRTVCMLTNEGADAVHQSVCDAAAVDTAMCAGVNYPRGPMEWSDSIGIDNVVAVLRHLHQVYGEDRYRVAPLLIRAQASGRRLL